MFWPNGATLSLLTVPALDGSVRPRLMQQCEDIMIREQVVKLSSYRATLRATRAVFATMSTTSRRSIIPQTEVAAVSVRLTIAASILNWGDHGFFGE